MPREHKVSTVLSTLKPLKPEQTSRTFRGYVGDHPGGTSTHISSPRNLGRFGVCTGFSISARYSPELEG